MLRVGLTGGIASGKSVVSARFQALGVPVIDADRLAREVVEPGQDALAEIVATFGAAVLAADGTLNRTALRRLVFADTRARRRLEGILHPRIRRLMRERQQALSAPYCILSIPLLLETAGTDQVDRILVVDASEAQQEARLQARDDATAQEARAMLAAQVTRAERLAAADDVIRNHTDLASLYRQVDTLHAKYLRLTNGDLPGTGE